VFGLRRFREEYPDAKITEVRMLDPVKTASACLTGKLDQFYTIDQQPTETSK
jgi:hypothetical protein